MQCGLVKIRILFCCLKYDSNGLFFHDPLSKISARYKVVNHEQTIGSLQRVITAAYLMSTALA
jgi:hypothetical protein